MVRLDSRHASVFGQTELQHPNKAAGQANTNLERTIDKRESRQKVIYFVSFQFPENCTYNVMRAPATIASIPAAESVMYH